MKNTDFMNLSLPEGSDKIDIEILNSDFTAIENLLKQHAIIETTTLNGEGVIIGAIGPYIRLQNIDASQVSIDIGKETYTLASGENVIIRETAENIGIITSGDVNITYFINSKTYADKEFYTKEKVDELLSNVEANIEVDAELSEESENPVQNKVITEQFSHYYTTTETDEKITEKVAEIVAGAPEDFDTLKEMSDWLTEHEDSAATMNSAIQKNASDISTANAAIQKNKTDISTANTNIQKNVDDITAVKNDVAINKSTLGVQCKNLLKPFNSETRAGITYTVNNDGSVVLSGSNTSSSYNYYSIPVKLEAGTYKVSGMPLTSSNSSYRVDLRAEATGGTVYGYGIKEFEVTFDEAVTAYYMIRIDAAYKESLDGITFYPMIRCADIIDDTYEPYKLSLQEQINTLIARIEALETATSTTEGGE